MSIKRAPGFIDSLGRYHETELEAVKAEAELRITQLFGYNNIDKRQVIAMVLNSEGLIRALQPVAEFMNSGEEGP